MKQASGFSGLYRVCLGKKRIVPFAANSARSVLEMQDNWDPFHHVGYPLSTPCHMEILGLLVGSLFSLLF